MSFAPTGSMDEALAATRRAATSGAFDAIVAAGGDGTIRLAARAIAGGPTPLGIVPLGTGNVLAHETGTPQDPDRLADLLMNGEVRSVHTATANGEIFVLMAGAGYDGQVIQDLQIGTKLRLGKLAYVVPAVQGLVRDMPELTLTIDGRPETAAWAIVANASRYGGRFHLTAMTGVEQSGLVAILLRERSRAALARTLLALATGRLGTYSAVTSIACQHVTITSPVPCPVQLDGDPGGTTPLDVRADGPILKVIMPPRRA